MKIKTYIYIYGKFLLASFILFAILGILFIIVGFLIN